jgi:predicted PurR-regulated permease PerM
VVTEAEAEMPLPSNPQTFFLGGIFALGVFATLYLASPIILPVVLAFVLKLLLNRLCVSCNVCICPVLSERS